MALTAPFTASTEVARAALRTLGRAGRPRRVLVAHRTGPAPGRRHHRRDDRSLGHGRRVGIPDLGGPVVRDHGLHAVAADAAGRPQRLLEPQALVVLAADVAASRACADGARATPPQPPPGAERS